MKNILLSALALTLILGVSPMTATAQEDTETQEVSREEKRAMREAEREAKRAELEAKRAEKQAERDAKKGEMQEKRDAMQEKRGEMQEQRQERQDERVEKRANRRREIAKRIVARLSRFAERLDQVTARIDGAIATANENGVDTAAASSLNEQAKSSVTAAKTAIAEVEAYVNTWTDEIVGSAEEIRAKYDEERGTLRSLAETAIGHLKSARDNARSAVQALRDARGTANTDSAETDETTSDEN